MNCLLATTKYSTKADFKLVMRKLIKHRLCIHLSPIFLWLIVSHLSSAVEYTYYLSREGESECKADGSRPYEGIMKRLFCTEKRVGKKCENDKFCNSTNNERCLCHNRCEELRCTQVEPSAACNASCDECRKDQCLMKVNCWNASNNCNANNSKACYKVAGTTSDYVCDCNHNYKGDICDKVEDPCLPNPCNGGVCTEIEGTSDFSCDCSATKFIGKTCTIKDECATMKCKDTHRCFYQNGKAQCVCKNGKTGPNCDQDQTSQNNCTLADVCNDGVCLKIDSNGKPICKCNPGITGARCDHSIVYCQINPCKQGGSCVYNTSGYHCQCTPHFTGKHCENAITGCGHLPSNPCKNGDCWTINNQTVYSCDCKDGWEGPNCTIRIPLSGHCSNNPCVNGSCVNFGNSFKCQCLNGFIGERCELKKGPCLFNPCHNNGVCEESGVNGYTCRCQPGFSGKDCSTNVNECINNSCVHGTCVDEINGYRCSCRRKYTGTYCEKKKPVMGNCDQTCNKKQGFCDEGICTCYPNYTGDNCNDMEPCNCMNNGTCNIYNRQCQCRQGYYGSRCQYVKSQCHKCNSAGTLNCTNYVGGYYCQCNGEYRGKKCDVKYDFCTNKNCSSHGKCVTMNNQGFCSCNQGYSGDNCSVKITSCSQKPCLNGATCKDNNSKYTCQCTADYTGFHCDVKIDKCQSLKCDHGKCVNGLCKCDQGYQGSRCDLNINDCKPNVCGVNGQCNDLDHGYECVCNAGFGGTNCSVNVDFCSRCVKNGGKCDIKNNCACPVGFTGTLCDTQVKEKCPYPECSMKFDGKTCNQKCNIHQCNWDGTDCSLGLSPWNKCKGKKCWEAFNNKKCDLECNNEDCLFDNFDCAPKRKCEHEEFCLKAYNNSVCDPQCNTPECAFDNMDCATNTAPKKVPGLLVMEVYSSIDYFKSKQKVFQRQLSILLNSNVKIVDIQLVDENGKVSRRRRSAKSIVRIKASLDNTNCVSGCFESTQGAAKYLAAKASKGELDLPFQLRTVKGESPTAEPPPIYKWLIIGGCVVAGILVIMTVLAGVKRVKSTLWFPSQSNAGQRSGPDGQEGEEMIALDQSSSESLDSARAIKHFKTDMIGNLDSQEWLNAYGMESNRQQHSSFYQQEHAFLEEIKKPTGANIEWLLRMVEEGIDVNMRDIDGRTPLHLSFFCSKDLFQRLVINRKSHLDIQSNDGMTPLMDACRLAEPDFAEELLNNCAKVTLVDNNGQSALHHAALTDSSAHCMLLLRANAKIDLQDNKGQTPLFLAARDNCQRAAYVLHRHCANANCCDNMDVSPITIARKNGHTEIVHMLSDTTSSPVGMNLSPSSQSPQYIMPSPNNISPTYIQPKTNPSHGRAGRKTTQQKKKKKNTVPVTLTTNPQADTIYTFSQDFDPENCINNFPEEWGIEPYFSQISGQNNYMTPFPTPSSVGIESPHDINSPNYIPTPFLTPSPETWSPGST